MAAGAGSGHRPFFLPARVLGRRAGVCVSIGARCPRPAFCLRVALLPLVLVACRTRDNPDVCTTSKRGLRSGPDVQPGHPAVRSRPGSPTSAGAPDPTDGPVGRPDRDGRPGRPTAAGRRGACYDRRQLPGRQADLLARRPLRGLPGADADCTTDPEQAGLRGQRLRRLPVADPTACASRDPPPPSAAARAPVSSASPAADCSQPTAPICVEGKCTRCTADTQCRERDGDDPGLCLAHLGGRCATDAEVIYVRATPPASTATDRPGHRRHAVLQSQDALEQVSADPADPAVARPGRRSPPLPVLPGFPGIAGGVISVIGPAGRRHRPGRRGRA